MFRLHFTADDLARVSFASSFGPYAEALFSIGVLAEGRRGDALYGGWRQPLVQSPNSWAVPLRGLLGRGPQLDLFTLMGKVATPHESTDALMAIGRNQLRAEVTAAVHWATAMGRAEMLPRWTMRLPDETGARVAFSAMLQDCISATVGQHWPQMKDFLDAEATNGARALAGGGVIALLNSLHPHMRWCDGALVVHEPPHLTDSVASHVFDAAAADIETDVAEIYLDGRGLTVVASVFCRRITPFVGVAGVDGPAVLFYPALVDVSDAHRLWASAYPGSSQRALSALLGSTRAAALEILSHPSTTTELATRLGTSLATASHHTTVLRQAGLISTRRRGGAVVHTITALGAALLDGDVSGPRAEA